MCDGTSELPTGPPGALTQRTPSTVYSSLDVSHNQGLTLSCGLPAIRTRVKVPKYHCTVKQHEDLPRVSVAILFVYYLLRLHKLLNLPQ